MESVSFVNLQNSIFIKADKKIHRKKEMFKRDVCVK